MKLPEDYLGLLGKMPDTDLDRMYGFSRCTAYNARKKKGIPKFSLSIEQRLWEKIDKSSGEDACWPWTGYRNKKGYGVFRRNGSARIATRSLMEFINKEPVPKDMMVCHHCDNPSCCNPKHLFIGTARENLIDSIQKGRFKATEYQKLRKYVRSTHCRNGHERTSENTIDFGKYVLCSICFKAKNERKELNRKQRRVVKS